MMGIYNFSVIPSSLISKDQRQKIILRCCCQHACHAFLWVRHQQAVLVQEIPVALNSGSTETHVLLPLQPEEWDALWELRDKDGHLLTFVQQKWKKPRQWTIYVMVSSHTDIGLHNSQYIQRANAVRFVDQAAKLCDQTQDRPVHDRYRYTIEGSWFWNNYAMDKGHAAAKRIVEGYIKPGRIGLCSGIAGNHFQTFGLEEMCRSTYGRRRLEEEWGIRGETLAMIDNNGMPMSMIQPYADAGYENIIFAPNQWNPLPSTVWKRDENVVGYTHNPEAAGGGSRIDVRYCSQLPMVFQWESPHGQRLTVWSSTQYDHGGCNFGIYSSQEQRTRYPGADEKMWQQLELLESRYPYDIWLFASYYDDQDPELSLTDSLQDWNSKWEWPKLRTLGDPNEPFRLLRQRFGDHIPVLKGDITGGWYQHPLTVPELMSQKYEADRRLATAEKWTTVACLLDSAYAYPATEFRRAWDHLLFNDEHSYGTSGYQGRRVYETWMQHRDWIEKAACTAKENLVNALQVIASHIGTTEASTVVFNATTQTRTELVESADRTGYNLVTVPPLGYRTIAHSQWLPITGVPQAQTAPPTVENHHYRLVFGENGAIRSIYDKELDKELLDTRHPYRANELVYTQDNHQHFSTPEKADFEVTEDGRGVTVHIRTTFPALRAALAQTIFLPAHEKRIEIDNRVDHAADLFNRNRYYRYLYIVFPFLVENSRRLCHLNGTTAQYAKDVTGHGTDVYMDVHEWCCCENDEFGVALIMTDSHVTEFDHIHPDKTDFANAGDGSQMFCYVANDWLQMHTAGGSHLNYRFRYAITSYRGDHQAAGIPEMAERFTDPVLAVQIPPQTGDLPGDCFRFLGTDPGQRLICLKRAEDGRGVIARFYGNSNGLQLPPTLNIEPATVDERPCSKPSPSGFLTYRIEKDRVRIPVKEPEVPPAIGTPAPIGSVYTGLITHPRAAAGEHNGHLYLLWGASMEENFSHYKLYRSLTSGFEANEQSFLADVYPEEYRVGRYSDTGLKGHTCYYYRVCPVDTAGVCGPLSEEFWGYTREELPEKEV